MFINWERAYSTHTPITIPLAGRGGSGSGGVSGVRTGAIGFDELVLIVCMSTEWMVAQRLCWANGLRLGTKPSVMSRLDVYFIPVGIEMVPIDPGLSNNKTD